MAQPPDGYRRNRLPDQWLSSAAAATAVVTVDQDDSRDEYPYPVIIDKIANAVVVHNMLRPFKI